MDEVIETIQDIEKAFPAWKIRLRKVNNGYKAIAVHVDLIQKSDNVTVLIAAEQGTRLLALYHLFQKMKNNIPIEHRKR